MSHTQTIQRKLYLIHLILRKLQNKPVNPVKISELVNKFSVSELSRILDSCKID